MEAQLHLLTCPPGEDQPDGGTGATATAATWRLDERTRDIGRQGVARAREALAGARRRHLDHAA